MKFLYKGANMSKKLAVIYARYSSDSQTEQSIDGQLRVCREFCERNGYGNCQGIHSQGYDRHKRQKQSKIGIKKEFQCRPLANTLLKNKAKEILN